MPLQPLCENERIVGTLFSTARAAYSRFTPRFIRESQVVARMKSWIPHDLMYDEAYYAIQVDPPALEAASVMGGAIVRELKPRNLIDVGCGTGALLSVLRDLGCTVSGLEYAEAGLKLCRSRNLNVRKFDLENDSPEGTGSYDLAISMEVAEHLPERCADRFVDLLSSLAPVVVFTAAYPGQGGADHVNEQPHSYWIAKFEERGLRLDAPLSDRWRGEWQAKGIALWYWKNIMVFRRESGSPR